MSLAYDNDASRRILTPRFVHQLVEDVARAYPQRVAVCFGDDQLTYQQLNDRADQLSQAILHTDAEADLIVISSTRNLEMVVGVLAILKAGKAYLPLDPTYPEQRLNQICADSGIQTCLAATPDVPAFEQLGLRTIASDQTYSYSSQPVSRPIRTAYVLYTSGSTGKPKGVCMGHGPLLNLLHWQANQSQAGPDTRTLQLAPLSFDVSFQEIMATLGTGGTLMLIEESLRLDPNALLSFVDQQSINRLFLPFVGLQFLAEAAVASGQFPTGLREIMTAGEQLKITPQISQFFSALPDCVLYNQYGPTECHVVTQLTLSGDPANWPALPTIGQPIDNVDLIILDEQLAGVPAGSVGEICLGGACLAEGYLHRPALTGEKFIELAIPQRGTMRLYRTGDLGRYLPDGSVEFLGRRDDQVKIRGHRIELGEIEVVLNQTTGVKQAVVTARDGIDGQPQLVAYLMSATGQADTVTVRTELEQRLPVYMMPSAFVWLDDFPKTSSGKVDKKSMPAPERKRPTLAAPYRKPRTELEQRITDLWSQVLQIEGLGLDDNFFELGGNSLLAQKTVVALKQHQYTLPITKLYQYPTPAGVVQYLQAPTLTAASAPVVNQVGTQADKQTVPQSGPASSAAQHADVAVIGMAGRFPGANSVDELWEVLKQGRETVRFFRDDELDVAIPEQTKQNPLYVKARGVLDGADQFDAQFFGLTPNVAQLMDPQQRIFLEIAWEALEQTGYLPQQYGGRVGVFAGCGNNTYYQNNIPGHPALIEQVGAFQVMTLNEKDYIASRTAYQLNLKGPAVSVYSACSTSLLAITQAVQSIRNGQCDVALAGGASITTPINSGHLYQEGAMLSRDGHCRSFDADAQGTVFSDGAGVVLFKAADVARRDGDTIYAIIKGVGVNNDGSGKGSFTAPSAEGQAGAIRMAIADARIDPATISYVEAHGTATPLGDPIEIDGLRMAFGEQTDKQFCAIGSIKSNLGHLTQAAGVAGLIKTALALYHRQLPASLHFANPNPAIDFAGSPFFVNTQLTDWSVADVSESVSQANPRRASPRRAGVSSFGVGGTNVHVVLEENGEAVPERLAWRRPVQLLTWSAKSAISREAYAGQLADALRETIPNLADVAYTLQTTRPSFSCRRFAVAATPAEAITQLQSDSVATSQTSSGRSAGASTIPDEVVFMFPGQGAQFLNMGRGLYENESVFQQAVDECADLLNAWLDKDIRQVMYPDAVDSEAEQLLRNTRYTQPALFVTEYALARLWMSWGITPSVFCGHSVGEFVAAHLAGIFSLADALKLVAARGRLVSELPRGSMLSVRRGAEQLQPVLPPTLSLAAINSRNLCVVAGPDEHIADFARLLDEQEIPNRPLLTSHAFHSAMMDPIVDSFAKQVLGISLHRPQMPIVSTVSGTWLTDAEATDPLYWARHLRLTVRFADALDTLLAITNPLLLEVGPGQTTATLARQQAGKRAVPVLAGLTNQADWPALCQSLLTTLGQLYLNGLNPNWSAFYEGQNRLMLKLPTYAFNRKRCWLDPVIQTNAVAPSPVVVSAPATGTNQIPPDRPTPAISLPTTPTRQPGMRKDTLIRTINQLLEEASGMEMDGVPTDMSFLEIGFDSLLLTQVALTLKKEFGLPITFRQLTNELISPALLADYLDRTLPPTEPAGSQPVSNGMPAQPVPGNGQSHHPVAPVAGPTADTIGLMGQPAPMVSANDSALGLIAQQLQLLAKQVALLQGGTPVASVPVSVAVSTALPKNGANGHAMVVPTASAVVAPVTTDTIELTPEEKLELKKPFGATARIERQASSLTTTQQTFIQELTQRYNQKTKASKAYAQQHRSHMADPRVVSGFRPLTKELVYPLVVNRSKGSRLWDIDGNEYIDALNGFGSNMFGYQPEWIKDVLHSQIEMGFEVGPQHELAGEVSQLICELTGAERAALCNTGSEAVLGTIRMARTVTGRSLIVAFSGSYHGINDEVLVRGTKKLKSFPAAPGIMPESVQNMLILDYGTDESLRIIRERAHELAAVLVEPVQSRRPEFVPIEFLKQLRTITAESGTALIFDEVITGFRTHPGGAQALFGIQADLASYGKVVGAGLPIGVVAGKKTFMDALDGGFWQYGDASVPEVGVTYFAGTFVRHPLALAAAKASLQYMKAAGPQLQQALTQKTRRLADALNAALTYRQLPLFVAQFGSLWKLKFNEDVPYGELLFTLLREKGIHIWDGFPCFLTEAHTSDEVDTLTHRFIESLDELIDAGFFKSNSAKPIQKAVPALVLAGEVPPVAGARLGRDEVGNPAWFIPNPAQPGRYLQINQA